MAFSTRLGVALWADCRDAAEAIDEPIHLVLTSPPYLLARPRHYGQPNAQHYVDWLCQVMEPLVKRLAPGGSVALNVGNDTFVPGSPARHLIPERLAVAFHDRLGLHKMDTLIWENPSKAPGPFAWASKKRVQLNVGWEPILWFCSDPQRCFADNRRVLRPHSEAHKKLIARGGYRRREEYGDGAHRPKEAAFAAQTDGAIPKNVLRFPTPCRRQRAARAAAIAAGLPPHGATFPLPLAEMLVAFLTEEGQLVADLTAGTLTVPAACETLGRRWVASDLHGESIGLAALDFPEAKVSPTFLKWLEDRRRQLSDAAPHNVLANQTAEA